MTEFTTPKVEANYLRGDFTTTADSKEFNFTIQITEANILRKG
jgi:hypothetical protein